MVNAINQSIYLQKKQAASEKESIELAAHGHIHNIKPQLYEQIKADEGITTKT